MLSNYVELISQLSSTYGGPAIIICKEGLIQSGLITIEPGLSMELTQAAFADKLGWTKPKLSVLIRGKRGITAETALDLAEALKTSPKVWMNLQATWDLDQAMKAQSA